MTELSDMTDRQLLEQMQLHIKTPQVMPVVNELVRRQVEYNTTHRSNLTCDMSASVMASAKRVQAAYREP